MSRFQQFLAHTPIGRVRAAMAAAPSTGTDSPPATKTDEERRTLGQLLAWAGAALKRTASALADLDRDEAIDLFIERPGAVVLWSLKLGRVPWERQTTLREQNTVAGMLLWIGVFAAFLAAVA